MNAETPMPVSARAAALVRADLWMELRRCPTDGEAAAVLAEVYGGERGCCR